MTRLPTMSSLVRIASSTVMPDSYMSAKNVAKRARMIFWSIVPTIGRRSLAWSHRYSMRGLRDTDTVPTIARDDRDTEDEGPPVDHEVRRADQHPV